MSSQFFTLGRIAYASRMKRWRSSFHLSGLRVKEYKKELPSGNSFLLVRIFNIGYAYKVIEGDFIKSC